MRTSALLYELALPTRNIPLFAFDDAKAECKLPMVGKRAVGFAWLGLGARSTRQRASWAPLIWLEPKHEFWKGQRCMARKATTLKKQVFQINEPDATSVLLVGDFTDWQQRAIPMEKGTAG